MKNLKTKMVVDSFIDCHNTEIAAELRLLDVDYIYSNLVNGVYGEVREVTTPAGKEREIEIEGSESYSGYDYLFNF